MGGTAVAEAGGVPAPVPTKTLAQHRTDLIAAITASLDECIKQSESNPDYTGVAPTKFTASITVDFPKGQIVVRPTLDLAKDIPAQVTTNADVTAQVPTQPS